MARRFEYAVETGATDADALRLALPAVLEATLQTLGRIVTVASEERRVKDAAGLAETEVDAP